MKHSDKNRGSMKKQYARMAEQGGFRPACERSLTEAAGLRGYAVDQIEDVPEEAIQMGLGCGNPTAMAQLQPGQIVLDLGSGGGLDAFVAAKKVGPTGKVIGVDMTAEMVEKARGSVLKGGYTNVEFHVGRIESLPLAEGSVDIVISNCVINHSTDKPAVFREAFRVLRPGGQLHVSDLVVKGRSGAANTPGMEIWRDWLAVACGKRAYLKAIRDAGFRDITIAAECPYSGPGMIPALAGRIVSLQLAARK